MTSQAKEKYTAEFKESAVKRESGNVTETARELGIKENTLYNWVYQYSRHAKPDKAVRTDEHLYDELKQLRKENAHLKEERDILKKAAAYPSLRSGQALPEKHGSDRMDSGAEGGVLRRLAVRTTRGQKRCKPLKRSKMRCEIRDNSRLYEKQGGVWYTPS